MDHRGRIIRGLSAGDFRVFDDGQEQTIAAFASGEEPLDLILLFDVSGSMRSAAQQVASAGQRAFLEIRSDDRVEVATFTSEVHVVAPLTKDREQLGKVLNHIGESRFRGRTRIQDAVDAAALQFLRMDNHNRRRRAVVAVTDDLGPPAHSETAVVENFLGIRLHFKRSNNSQSQSFSGCSSRHTGNHR